MRKVRLAVVAQSKNGRSFRGMKLLLMGFLSALSFCVTAQNLLVNDGFNGSSTLFPSITNGTYYTTNSASNDRPASIPFYTEGTGAIGVTNTTLTMISQSFNSTNWCTGQMSFRLGAWSIGNTSNGLDGTDNVVVEVSPDGGTTWYNTVTVSGNNNAYWSYSGGNANASTAYDGNNTTTAFAPGGSGSRTNDGYSTVTITNLPKVANMRIRITANNNDTRERWTIDDFRLTYVETLGWVNTQFPGTASICEGQSTVVYGRVWQNGLTNASGQGAGVTGQLGYSTTNTPPATWTNWVNATYNVDQGSNDEYQATLSGLSSGTYYYAYRFFYNGCVQFGGYSSNGGGFWNGSNYVSGVLTVTPGLAMSSAAGTNIQTVCINNAITNVTYNLPAGATGTTVSGLPTGVTSSISGSVLTLSGTPSVSGTFNYTVSTTAACGAITSTGTITVSPLIDWGNLQFPATGAVCQNATFNVYGRVYEAGVTEAAGQGAGIAVEFGYNTSNTNPNTWSAGSWSAATFNTQSGNNDEYVGTIPTAVAGTYYYAFRYRSTGCAWQYGGYNVTGGGFWDGVSNVNGELTVNTIFTPSLTIASDLTTASVNVLYNMTTAAPTTASNVTVSAVSQVNSFGAVGMISGTSSSVGYAGVSGGNNAAIVSNAVALNTATTPYFQFSITAASNYDVALTGISFGSRSTGSGPTQYALRCSADGYATNLATGTMLTNSTWVLFSHTIQSVLTNTGLNGTTTFRIYGFATNATATSGTANWRIDDMTLNMTVTNGQCSGSPITFTATPTNGGTTPAYQWAVNGTNAGSNSATFTTSSLTNGALVLCTMTANNACQTASTLTSNTIEVPIITTLTPSVVVTSSDANNSICEGTSVTFTAAPTNGGSIPAYQWKLNGTDVGTNATTYTTTTLANNDVVTVVLTANNICQTSATANGNSITTTVISNVTPSVVIASNDADNSFCSGTNVTFTATPTNGGTTPAYQWRVNGTNVGTNSATYSTTALTNGQIVTVVMTANNACQTANTATSTGITNTVITTVTPTVAIVSDDANNNFCAGTNVTFTATPTNGGSTPAYQWQVNGANVGTNSNTYSTTALTNGQTVRVVMTANNVCQSVNTVNSNTITNTVVAYVTPSVAIVSSDADNSICAGTSVTFTATPTNGGTTPAYQWTLNGANVGTNSNTYTNALLTNNDVVTVVMTANNACQTSATANGNSITTAVISNLTPSVSIGASTASVSGEVVWNMTSIAAATTMTGVSISNISVGNSNNPSTAFLDNTQPSTGYTGASAGNSVAMSDVGGALSTAVGGSVYFEFTVTPQSGYWFSLNAIGFGSRSSNGNGGPTAFTLRTSSDNYATSLYTGALNASSAWDYISFGINNTLANSSSPITFRIYGYNGANNTSSVNWRVDDLLLEITTNTLSTTTSPSYCNGATPLFIAAPTNGGNAPSYQWKLNGVNVGANSTNYANPNLVNNDVVSVVMTANNVCQTANTATSNNVTVLIQSSTLSTTGTSNCGSGTVTVSATSSCGLPGSSIAWYAAATGGAILATGSNYTTTASASSIFYAQENFVGGEINYGNSSSGTTNRGLQFNLNADILLNSVNIESSAATTITIQLWNATTQAAMVIGGNTMSANRNLVTGNNLVNLGWNIPAGNGYRLVVTAISGGANLTRTTIYLFPQALTGVGMITGNVDGGGTDRYNFFYNWNYSTTRVPATITITNPVTPSVTVTSNDADNSICAGTSVTFTAAPTNGGTTPAYQWKLNGNNVGTNATTYSTTTLANNDVVTVVLTANNTCQSSATANGNNITTTVNNNVTPSVAVTSNDADNSICSGTSVTFTAAPTNGGTTPAYQWKLNGTNVGTNATTYTNTTLANNDVVTVVLTANNTCQTAATANGNNITTAVINNVTPSVAVTSNDADNSICSGTSVTFTAAPTNGGTTPAYQWKLNGTNVGTNATTYSTTTLANNDVVTVVLTANNTCQTAATANGNNITTTVINNVTPSVAVTSNDADNSICSGTSVTFTAAPTNGGTTPAYQWKLNGTNVGTNATTYTSSALTNGAIVTVVLTANNNCQTTATANGNNITTAVINYVTPSVSIVVNNAVICPGAGNVVTFTATPTNGGTLPAYQWKVNGNNVGTNSAVYTSSTLAGGDNIKVDMLANNQCQTVAVANSNSVSITALPVYSFYADNDGDGYGNPSTGVSDCFAPDGYVMDNTDCLDTNGDVYPDGFEICNGADDNCDGNNDEGVEMTTYYLDNDGDGFGGATGSIQSCDIPSGYIQQGGDCNDNNGNVKPTAAELCSTNFDDDCDGLINEICFPGNDNPLFASNCPLSTSTTLCSSVTGTLQAATATTSFGSGTLSNNPDVWFYFTANAVGMTIRCTPSVNDIGLELRTSSGVLLKSMNALSGAGDEYMNYDALSVGNQYYLRVMNMNTAVQGGAFSLCARRIVPTTSAFNYTNVYVYNTGCTNVIPTNLSTAVSSTIILTPVGGGTSYSAPGPVATLGEFVSSNGNGIVYNTVYAGQIVRSSAYPLGDGSTELLTFTTNMTNTLNVLPAIDIDLSSLYVCPSLRTIGSLLRSDRWLCGAVKYQWRFEQYLNGQPYLVNGNPVIIEQYGANGSRDIYALASYGFVPGSEWRVKIRPVFSNNVHGDYGSDEQCVKFKGSLAAAPTIESGDEVSFEEGQTKTQLYPNPSNGGTLNLFQEQWLDAELKLVIYDAMGRKVFENLYQEKSMIQENLSHLTNGVYTLEMQWGSKSEQLHWMIQR